MFEQYAKGNFTIAVEGEFHCGPDGTSPKNFDYEVLIEWPDGSLDPNGFLLDNLTFDNFFRRCGKTALSCEEFVQHCSREFMGLCGGVPDCVQVTIWAIKDKVRITKSLKREEFKVEREASKADKLVAAWKENKPFGDF